MKRTLSEDSDVAWIPLENECRLFELLQSGQKVNLLKNNRILAMEVSSSESLDSGKYRADRSSICNTGREVYRYKVYR